MDPKKLVAEGYDRLYDTYAAWTTTGDRHRYIDRSFDLGLRPPADALDLGCGTGRHATAYLVERGLAVTGVDLSPKSIEAAEMEVPGARFFVGDMTSIQLPATSFDLVTAFYSIIQVPNHQHAAVLNRIASWLRPGGYLVMTMGGGPNGGSGTEDAWLGVTPMYWSNWDAATNRQLVADAGFDVLEANLEVTKEDGRDVIFLWVVARKPLG